MFGRHLLLFSSSEPKLLELLIPQFIKVKCLNMTLKLSLNMQKTCNKHANMQTCKHANMQHATDLWKKKKDFNFVTYGPFSRFYGAFTPK